MSDTALLECPPALEVGEEVGVLEDDPETRNSISAKLRRIGVSPVEGEGEDHAVDLAQHRGVRFFIVDVNLGQSRAQEGLDALERLKKLEKDVKVAVYTNY